MQVGEFSTSISRNDSGLLDSAESAIISTRNTPKLATPSTHIIVSNACRVAQSHPPAGAVNSSQLDHSWFALGVVIDKVPNASPSPSVYILNDAVWPELVLSTLARTYTVLIVMPLAGALVPSPRNSFVVSVPAVPQTANDAAMLPSNAFASSVQTPSGSVGPASEASK
jgi:hypothetical protein